MTELVMATWEDVRCPISGRKRHFKTCKKERCIQLVENPLQQKYGCRIRLAENGIYI